MALVRFTDREKKQETSDDVIDYCIAVRELVIILAVKRNKVYPTLCVLRMPVYVQVLSLVFQHLRPPRCGPF